MVKNTYVKVEKSHLFIKLLACLLSILFIMSFLKTGSLTSVADTVTFDGETSIYIDVSACSWALDDSAVPSIFLHGDNNMSWTNAVRVSNGIYSVTPPMGKYYTIEYERKTESGTYNRQTNIPLSEGNNILKVNSNFEFGSWDTYIPPKTIYNADLGSSITNEIGTDQGNLLPINAQFFDYYTDSEVENGWRNYTYQNSHGDWEPYHEINKAIAALSSDSGWKYPLYFGNFWHKPDGWTGSSTSNYNNESNMEQGGYLTNFSNWVNNSAGWDENAHYKYSVLGLTDSELEDNMMKMKGNNGTLDFAAPYFDSEWLTKGSVNGTGTALGTVVNSQFPMRVTEKNGDVYYEFWNYDFDKGESKDNVYFTGYESGNLVLEYGYGSDYAVYDASENYGGDPDHPGFFPFDTNESDAENFGFGMRLDFDFNVGKNGKTESGKAMLFEFEGDDDVWVYIDGKLVLDMGGVHKKAKGSINFNAKTATIETGTRSLVSGEESTNTYTTSFDWFDNLDNTATHTITVFYMERGMVESNLKLGFSITPVGNKFIVDKTVETEEVNAGLQDAVKTADDSFRLKHQVSETENGTYTIIDNYRSYDYQKDNEITKKYPTGGYYSLEDGASATFTDMFTTGHWFSISEDLKDKILEYKPSWIVRDLKTGVTIDTGTTTDSNFQFLTTSEKSTVSTQLQLSYVNTPKVRDVSFTKVLKNYNDNVLSDDKTDFNGTFTVSLDGGETYSPYPLQYKISGSEDTYALTSEGKLNDSAQLRVGRTITFTGIPVNAKIKFIEDEVDGFYYVDIEGYSSNVELESAQKGGILTVIDSEVISDNSAIVTNKKDAPLPTTAVFTAFKTLNGGTKDFAALGQVIEFENGFQFELYEVDDLLTELNSDMTPIDTKSNDKDGNINFDEISYYFKDVGSHYYVIKEVVGDNAWINYDAKIYRVKVEVIDNETDLSTVVTYYNADGKSSEANNVVFENTTKEGSITINKKDGKVGLKDAKFTLQYADDEWNPTLEFNFEATTDDNGKAEFVNLPIGNYILTEVETSEGHMLLREPILITIPLEYKAGDIISGTAMTEDGVAFDLTYDIINNQFIDMPTAGGIGIHWYYMGGAIILLASIPLFMQLYKKNKKA